jgi:hypothetical protein
MTSTRRISTSTACKRGRLVASALLAAALSGCSGVPDAALVDPAKYTVYDCANLAKAMTTVRDRMRELYALEAKAGRQQPGVMISALTYTPEVKTLRGETALIEQESRRKDCQPPVVATR